MKSRVIAVIFTTLLFVVAWPTSAAGLAVGAAPKGDPTAVASKIIKYNFPECKHVSNASRSPDGSIRAKCDGTNYLVFTVFNPKEGKVLELAMNCTAAKSLLNVSC
jgi:hypothetical protein